MDKLISGFNFYKSVQGKPYEKNEPEVRNKLSKFREELGKFTDKIFIQENGLLPVSNGKGMWQNSGHFTKYMWNRYKIEDNDSTLVIYFNASTNKNEGLFISIGLIDDKISEFEKKHKNEIYNFLEQECKQIECIGFERRDAGWGERVFFIVDEQSYNDIDYKCLIDKLKDVYMLTIHKIYHNNEISEEINIRNNNKQTQPLNQILYGPPGTGKTYNTINKALEILDSVVPEDRREAKDRFEEYKQAGQIEFITFHQSYGYEEFVEGIKAIPPKEKGNENGLEMIYKVVNGIFKKLSNTAKENYENSKKTSTQLIQEKSLKQKIEQFLNDALETQSEFTKTKGGKFKINDLSETSISIFTEDSNYSKNIIELDIAELIQILSSEIDIKTSRQLAKEIFGINNQRQKDTYYFSMLKKFKEIKFDSLEEIEAKEPLKNYILIIDEINRGNISKIFGELITLIEPGKRIGADEALHVRLPYSNELFGVPQNFYIIGTMNTADRSIALMDTALRRRFDFTEMMPDLSTLDDLTNVDGINVKAVLKTINKRIEYLYDRDHTIGHAFFMSLKDDRISDKKTKLDNIFRNKIIPLLQEYFYDDWEKILMVLSNGFIEKEDLKSDIFDYKTDEYLEDEKYLYTINKEFSKEAYQKLCGKMNDKDEGVTNADTKPES